MFYADVILLKPPLFKGGFGSGKHTLIYMADDFDAPLKDFKDYM